MKPDPSYLGLVTLPADPLLPSAAIHPAHIGAKGTLFIFIHNRHTEIIFIGGESRKGKGAILSSPMTLFL